MQKIVFNFDQFLMNFSNDLEKIINLLIKNLSYLYINILNIEKIKKIQFLVSNKVCNLEQIASIFLKDKSTAVIELFDKTLFSKVLSILNKEKFNIKLDKDKIFIFSDHLTTEKRLSLEKEIKKVGEQTKFLLKRERQSYFHKIRKYYKEKIISEDDLYQFEKSLQKVFIDFNVKNDDLIKKKLITILLH